MTSEPAGRGVSSYPPGPGCSQAPCPFPKSGSTSLTTPPWRAHTALPVQRKACTTKTLRCPCLSSTCFACHQEQQQSSHEPRLHPGSLGPSKQAAACLSAPTSGAEAVRAVTTTALGPGCTAFDGLGV